MPKSLSLLFFVFNYLLLIAQFPPAADQAGTSAIHKDDAMFVNWATEVIVERGEQNIVDDSLNFAEAGEPNLALGIPDIQSVSLGDGGSAILTFEKPIRNGVGPDFAIFENGFPTQGGYFLELAFVEVSSDGHFFVRFPATSLTDTSEQLKTFDLIDPTQINNLAGKYVANYGTPFDLEELNKIPELDINAITHVKIIDVIGSIADSLATFDAQGNKINDPFPTPFPTGGFDLDAVGVIHENTSTNTEELITSTMILAYPNPIKRNEHLSISVPSQLSKNSTLELTSSTGQLLKRRHISQALTQIPLSQLSKGVYWLKISNYEYSTVKKIVVLE